MPSLGLLIVTDLLPLAEPQPLFVTVTVLLPELGQEMVTWEAEPPVMVAPEADQLQPEGFPPEFGVQLDAVAEKVRLALTLPDAGPLIEIDGRTAVPTMIVMSLPEPPDRRPARRRRGGP